VLVEVHRDLMNMVYYSMFPEDEQIYWFLGDFANIFSIFQKKFAVPFTSAIIRKIFSHFLL